MSNAADGAMAETSNMLVRMRELALQSMNGTYGTDERNAMDSEFQHLISEIDRVANVTEFNGTKLLNASTAINFHVGAEVTTNDRITIYTVDVDKGTLGLSGKTVLSSQIEST